MTVPTSSPSSVITSPAPAQSFSAPPGDGAQFLDDLIQLRAGALVILGWITGSISYLCLIFLIWPVTGASVPWVLWQGILVLAAVSTLAIVSPHRYQRAMRYGYVAGVHLCAACSLLALGTPESGYFFILPIIFANVLFNRWLALVNAVVAVLLIALLNHVGLGIALWGVTPLLSILTTAVVAVASWLAANNLYTALTWLASAYTTANTNQRLARERQAELQRVLKALDEAHYRLRRLNGLLVTARDQAEEGRRIKQYFAQTISHELRTPLNLVVGFAELMVESPEYYGAVLPSSYLRDLRIIYRNAHHLQGLVNDVLDLARIDAAQVSLIVERVEPGELTCEAVETVRSLVESRGLTLATNIADDLPQIWLDATRIRQVLINLLNNAARFTRKGSVTVTVQPTGEDLLFAVSDTGIGIAPADLARIFDEFYQVDGGTNRQQGGAGLGLAISRKFVGLHGGRMWAESMVGQGTTIFFTLPVARTAEILPRAEILDREVAAAPGGRDTEHVLLVVTTSNSAVRLLSRYLTHYRVLATGDLGQAQTLARQVMPQAVILDSASVHLSQEELGELGSAWGLPQVPVITSPLPGEEPLQRRLAVDGYLIKPVVRQNLWDVVRSFGESVEQILIVDDNRDFVRLLRQMLANPLRPYRIESVYSGEEALASLHLTPPDLILLDLGLPDMNGVELVEILRRHPVWHSIPIVIVSAQDELDGLEVMHGALTVSKAGGLLPGDLVRWLGAFMGSPPADSALTSGNAHLLRPRSMAS